MTLSNGEKLILIMLSEIYKHLGIKGEIDPEFVIHTLYSDHLWGLRWKYDSLFNADGRDPAAVQETCDILDMYRLLTRSFNKLPPAEQTKVRAEAAPFEDYVKFQGFDANNDDHYGVGQYLVEHLGRYDELKDKYLNSHSSSTLPKYRRMLQVFRPMIDPYPLDGLSADQIIEILKA